MVSMKRVIFIIVVFLLPVSLFPQEVGFMGIHIGLTRDQVVEVAENNPLIDVPKNRDVELFPVEERKILTLSIKPEVPYMYLQFYNNKLYSITIIFDEKYINYYALCSTIEKKYGEHKELSPSFRKWSIENINIIVEKPSVVKYIALKPFLEATGFKKESQYDKEKRKKLLLDNL